MKEVRLIEAKQFMTVGKMYKVVEESPDFFVVKDDRGMSRSFFKRRFEVIPPTLESRFNRLMLAN
jgi:hypothetical protein